MPGTRESAGLLGTARIERLRVQNYRVLRDLELRDISPLTVLLGPNGSGKSTLFDVFAFLSECFTDGLRRAWDKRNRFRELRSRGAGGPIVFELKYRERRGTPVITYHLAINERRSGPVVADEWLQWKRGRYGRPLRFLDFREGAGEVISGEQPELNDQRNRETLESPDLLAVNTLGQFARHPRVSALRRFISGWYLFYIAADSTRGVPEAGPQERLSQTGVNLPNVIQYLKEQHPDRLSKILEVLARRIPRLERVDADLLADGRLLLQIKDEPFEQPILTSSGCCTGTTMGSLGLDLPARWTRSSRSWPREPSSGTCGWRGTSRSVTLSLLRANLRGRSVHLEFLVEEQSAEVALRILVPKIVGQTITFDLHPFQGKHDLMRGLPARLRAYARWVQPTWIQAGGTGIVVLIDEDRQDCKRLKAELEDAAAVAGLPTKSSVEAGIPFVVLNRVVVEELEAWFLGDCEAIRAAYPTVPGSIERRSAYRQPDEIRGGTWEAWTPLATDPRASDTSAPAYKP